jgi:integrase
MCSAMAERVRLTDREIKALACPPGKRDVLVFDAALQGFAVRVTSSGSKSFLLQYRRGDAVHRLALGKVGDVSAAEARRLAELARGRLAAGGHPVAEKSASLAAERNARADAKRAKAADALTLARLVEQWAAVGLKSRSADYRHEAPAALARALAAHWHRPAHALTTRELQKRIDTIDATMPTTALHVKAYGRSAFNWAQRRGLVVANPFAPVVIETRLESRARALTDGELAAVWNALEAMTYPFGPYFRLLLLTLQRRDEVAAMRWAELAPDFRHWTLPAGRAKNRRAHIVHLCEPARAILAGIPRRAGSDLVFTTTGLTPISGFSRGIRALRDQVAKHTPAEAEAADEADRWRLHDFRRTGVTVLARLGVLPHVADKLLNHVGGTISGVAAIYQRHEFLAERAAALDLWAAHVLAVARAAAEDR